MDKKDDYYYDAMELLSAGEIDGALDLLEKARKLDKNYVQTYVGLWAAYKDLMLAYRAEYKKHVNRAFLETRKRFPKWPKDMPWGYLENRQYLRSIAEKAFAEWEDGNKKEAEKLMRLILKMNPNDNQGIRFCLAGMFADITPEEVDRQTDRGNALQDWNERENMLARENKKHKFWKRPKEN